MCAEPLYFKAILALQPIGKALITQAPVGISCAFTPSRLWAGLCYWCIVMYEKLSITLYQVPQATKQLDQLMTKLLSRDTVQEEVHRVVSVHE